jgi:hypothetical protein
LALRAVFVIVKLHPINFTTKIECKNAKMFGAHELIFGKKHR